ncbi:DUF2269 family protein [Lentibacillus sediminis]|uniref:DUF2269 family protein n=1 Tax=Lentibacillus sediminis TaxID=1940529 RepID=UPI000C1C3036|nr:DUF2269 family protein [Lentibacillus sediminis]
MGLHEFLVFTHIISAILGMGPGFMMIHVVKNAGTMTELRHAYQIRHQLHIPVMVGGTLLLITGLWMGFLQPHLFSQGWYGTSLFLFLLALAGGPFVMSPRSRPIKRLLRETEGEKIPEAYYTLARRLFFYERIENTIFIVIIVLMILKPF